MEKIRFFLPSVKGIGGHSRFIQWKPTWIGFTACPLGVVLASNWVQRVRGSRRFCIVTPVSNSILCVVTGKDDAEVFCFRLSFVWGRASRPSKPSEPGSRSSAAARDAGAPHSRFFCEWVGVRAHRLIILPTQTRQTPSSIQIQCAYKAQSPGHSPRSPSVR